MNRRHIGRSVDVGQHQSASVGAISEEVLVSVSISQNRLPSVDINRRHIGRSVGVSQCHIVSVGAILEEVLMSVSISQHQSAPYWKKRWFW